MRAVQPMPNTESFDIVVVGGGLVGLATARALLMRAPKARLALLEKENEVAAHQSGRNSGVMHSGIYYAAGSLKAELTKKGRAALMAYCDERGIPYELCGKVIIATREGELPLLERFAQRGRENGVNLREIDSVELTQVEPHAHALRALHLPGAGIVDFGAVARHLAEDLAGLGAELRLGERLVGIRETGAGLHLDTASRSLRARSLVNCAGLFSDRVARMAGLDPGLRIVPFRGGYFRLRPSRRYMVRGLIYPLPDPRFPFLGVHLTRTMSGEVLVGPNAVLSLKREGYRKVSFNMEDALDALTYPGLWRMALSNLSTGLGEMLRAWSVAAFTRHVRQLMPELSAEDLLPARAGVRAQAIDRAGNLVEDFRFVRTQHSLHVLNAPSPAATAALAIGEYVAEQVLEGD